MGHRTHEPLSKSVYQIYRKQKCGRKNIKQKCPQIAQILISISNFHWKLRNSCLCTYIVTYGKTKTAKILHVIDATVETDGSIIFKTGSYHIIPSYSLCGVKELPSSLCTTVSNLKTSDGIGYQKVYLCMHFHFFS